MKEDDLITAIAEDKIRKSRDQYTVEKTGFLDLHQQSLVKAFFSSSFEKPEKKPEDGTVCSLYGGYEDAERRMLIVHPDFIPVELSDHMCVLRLKTGGKADRLSHRDYLGAVLGTGISRAETGDILVREGGADVIIAKEMGEFLCSEITSIGRYPVSAETAEIGSLMIPKMRVREIKTTVSSPRLDSIVSSVFGISRSKAQAQIKAGRVFADSEQIEKPEKLISAGMKVVLRGSGKAVIREVGEEKTKKDRVWVRAERYL